MIFFLQYQILQHPDVPEGTDENFNKVIETKGEIKKKILKKNHIMNWRKVKNVRF